MRYFYSPDDEIAAATDLRQPLLVFSIREMSGGVEMNISVLTNFPAASPAANYRTVHR